MQKTTEVSRFDRLGPALLLTGYLVFVWIRGGASKFVIVEAVAVVLIVGLSLIRRGQLDVLTSAVDSIGIYLLASVGLYLLGLKSPGEAGRLGALDNNLGVLSSRVVFPLAGSYAIAPTLAAGYIAAVVALGMTGRRWWVHLRPVCLVAAGFVLLAGDYRGPLVYAVLVAVGVFAAPRLLTKAAPLIAVAILLLPLWQTTGGNAVSLVQDVVPILHREDNGTALSNRELIWTTSLHRYNEVPTSKKLVGFGPDGHVASGASALYAPALEGFLSFSIVGAASPHNSFLQTLLDGGLVGVGLYLAALVWTFVRLRRRFTETRDPAYLAGVAMLLVFAATAGTEVTVAFSAGAQEPAWLFALLALVVSASRQPVAEPASNATTVRRTLTVVG